MSNSAIMQLWVLIEVQDDSHFGAISQAVAPHTTLARPASERLSYQRQEGTRRPGRTDVVGEGGQVRPRAGPAGRLRRRPLPGLREGAALALPLRGRRRHRGRTRAWPGKGCPQWDPPWDPGTALLAGGPHRMDAAAGKQALNCVGRGQARPTLPPDTYPPKCCANQ